jgi:hypothetical protein
MMNRFTKLALVVLVGGSAVGFYAGCDRGDATQSNGSTSSGTTASAEPFPANLVLAEAPANATNVAEVVKAAKDGEEVVLIGKVGGRKEPFVAGRALMTVVDTNQRSCKDMEKEMAGENCPTPWDYCCIPQHVLAPNLATVQFVGADGKPLKADLSSVSGLKPLTEVVVKGTAQRGPDGKSLVINATGVYVRKS